MSNLLKQSNAVGPGFDQSAFFLNAKSVEYTFDIGDLGILRFKDVLEMVFEIRESSIVIVYQNAIPDQFNISTSSVDTNFIFSKPDGLTINI